MKIALIGYTGFVGSNIAEQYKFDLLFNSSNIQDIRGKKIDLLVIAAPSATKWKANQEPEADWKIISELIENLKDVKADKVVHISTVDVYKSPIDVDEDTPIAPKENHPYGKHRYYLEEFIKKNFDNHLIVRLPGLFGKGLKKNFIFDMLNNNCLDLTHKDSVFQFYYLNNIWNDIQVALNNKLHLINFATEPISTKDVARFCFDKDFDTVTTNPPALYDMKSKHASLYKGGDKYLYTKGQIVEHLKDFIKHYAK
jgi:dTDP-4-dehydrorhamnose reductase